MYREDAIFEVDKSDDTALDLFTFNRMDRARPLASRLLERHALHFADMLNAFLPVSLDLHSLALRGENLANMRGMAPAVDGGNIQTPEQGGLPPPL